jgi:YVTN family beta-propeller protein
VLDGAVNCSCVHRVDPSTNRVVATIPLGTPSTQGRVAPLGAAATADAIWIANRWGTEDAPDGSVMRIDPATNRVVAIVPLGSSPEVGGPTGIAAGTNAVWAGVPSTKSVVRIDPATNSVVATIPGFACAEGQLAANESGVWVADCDAVRYVDGRTNTITRTIPIDGAIGYGVRGIGLGFGSLWAEHGPLVRIDPASGAVIGRLRLPPAYTWTEYSLAFGFGSIWARRGESVIRVAP